MDQSKEVGRFNKKVETLPCNSMIAEGSEFTETN